MIDRKRLERAGLGEIARKVERGERLDREEGVLLYEHPDLNLVGSLANQVRERMNGNVAYYNVNQHINPTNVCDKFCKFCAFYRTPKDADAYSLSFEQIQARVREKLHEPITEIHMVGGVNPELPLEYYLDMIRAVHDVRPEVHVKALTMVEVADFAQRTGRSVESIILDLKEAGIGSFPGGGAEVMSARLHRLLFPKKIDFRGWLECAKTAHRAGLKSNATMLYGHVETSEEKVDHLILLREAQDETGGFNTFIPLAFHPENTKLDHLKKATAVEDLRNIAVPRLMLDNFPHIKAFWIMITPRVAQIALAYGADDIDGTVTTEEIVHSAGAETSQHLSRRDLVGLIREAGRDPVERDTLYRPIGTATVATGSGAPARA
ncbi:MAG TPA: aminofutalosine synthase MqnE [Candidatus Polarisedimenticolia bacterium]|nr:aminofutalosine synthase MqnE [Candidatus Polarisedimenticolia bacterium]